MKFLLKKDLEFRWRILHIFGCILQIPASMDIIYLYRVSKEDVCYPYNDKQKYIYYALTDRKSWNGLLIIVFSLRCDRKREYMQRF